MYVVRRVQCAQFFRQADFPKKIAKTGKKRAFCKEKKGRKTGEICTFGGKNRRLYLFVVRSIVDVFLRTPKNHHYSHIITKKTPRTNKNHQESPRNAKNHKEPSRTTNNYQEPPKNTKNHQELFFKKLPRIT